MPFPTNSDSLAGTPVSLAPPADGQVLTFNAETGEWEPTTLDPGVSDEKVKVSLDDTTPAFLSAKLGVVENKLTATVLNPGLDELLQLGLGADAFDKSTDDLDDIEEGSTSKHFTSSNESELEAAYNHSGVTSGNPHGVTKSDVSLSNVTNDAQLKRAAGDFATFTEKAQNPQAGDLMLLEDSGAAGAKKKLNLAYLAHYQDKDNLPPSNELLRADGSGGVVGTGRTTNEFFRVFSQDEAETYYTGTTDWQTKVSNTSLYPAGFVEILATCAMIGNDAPTLFGLSILIDGVTRKAEASFDLAGKKYSDGAYHDRTARVFVSLTAGNHTIALQFKTGNAGKTVYIKNAAISARKGA